MLVGHMSERLRRGLILGEVGSRGGVEGALLTFFMPNVYRQMISIVSIRLMGANSYLVLHKLRRRSLGLAQILFGWHLESSLGVVRDGRGSMAGDGGVAHNVGRQSNTQSVSRV